MAGLLWGRRNWEGSRDSEGHRTYKVSHLVKSDFEDGPAQILQTAGLPLPGAPWIFGNDVDLWAWCRPDAEVKRHMPKEGEKHRWWTIEQTFSTKPLDNKKQRCNDTKIEDPLLEPPKLTGSSSKYTEEATHDRFGTPILNSAYEMLRGQQVEFDKNRPTIKVEMNIPSFNTIALAYAMQDMVNDRPLWGFPRRCIKLSNVSWERKFYGVCYKYYTLMLEFEIRYDSFDRDLLDEGTKVLHGEWKEPEGTWRLLDINDEPPNPFNPAHFDKFKDRQGENCRVVLNGDGLPAGVIVTSSADLAADCVFASLSPTTIFKNYNLIVEGVRAEAEINFGLDEQCVDCNSLNGNHYLQHSHDCVWETDSVTTSCYWETTIWRMYYESATDFMVIELNATNVRYIIPLGEFVPRGRNVFSLSTVDPPLNNNCDVFPDFITIEPFEDQTDVGSIHVEKYRETNFLALGIPISF